MSPVVLVILIAWALLSVIFLTGTLLAARSIDRSVSGVTNRTGADGKPEKNIKTTVEEIGREGKFIDEARKTVQISAAILKAAKPLSPSLGRTDQVAKTGIDPKLKRILGKVNEINEVAGRINTNVVGIHGTVDTIFTSVIEINQKVKHIGSLGVNIRTSANQINGSARTILGSLSSVLALVQHIDGTVDGIIGQAKSVKAVTAPILEDFHGIRRNVGGAEGGRTHGNTVTGHANGIDCSILLLGSQMCNK
jgi:hypothetical protein